MDNSGGGDARQSQEESWRRLGLDPRSFLDDVFNAADDYLADSHDALELHLLEKQRACNEAQKDNIRKAVDAIHHFLESALDLHYPKFEEFAVGGVFCVAAGLQIPDGNSSTALRDREPRGSGAYFDEDLDAELAQVRGALAQEQTRVLQMKRELHFEEKSVQRYRGLAPSLQDLADQHTAAPDGLVDVALSLQALIQHAHELRGALGWRARPPAGHRRRGKGATPYAPRISAADLAYLKQCIET